MLQVGTLATCDHSFSVQVVRAVEERTHEERQSTAVDTLDDTELFFVDKVRRLCIDSLAEHTQPLFDPALEARGCL